MTIKRLQLLPALFGFFILTTLFNGHATAATNGNTMPYAPDFSGSEIQLVVSRPFDGNSLEARTSKIRIYSTSQRLNIDIFGFNHCSYINGGDDTNTFAPTTYKITTTDQNETESGTLATSIRTNSHSCQYDINTPLNISLGSSGNKSVKSIVKGHTAYYVYDFQADMTGSGVNGFKVRVNNSSSLIGFNNTSGDKFALQNRTNSSTGSSTFNIPFAADCDTVTTTTNLFWSDDDWGTLQRDRGSFYFRVRDDTVGAYVSLSGNGQNNVSTYYPDGGPGASQSVRVNNFNPDDKYEWQWDGVTDKNGIQFRLPYDSINFNTTCPPSGWTLTGTSSVSRPAALPGASVTFTHKVTNTGPAIATPISAQVGTVYAIGSTTYPSVPNISIGIGAARSYTISKTYTIPSTATAGQDYCQYINFSKSTGPAGPNRNSVRACVRVGSVPPPPPLPVGCFSPTTRSVALDRSTEASWSPAAGSYDGATPAAPPYTGPTPRPSNSQRQATTQTQVTYTYTRSTVNATTLVNSNSPDQYGDGAPTTYSESPTSTANVNYAPYVTNYPYDTHTPVVGYTVTYKQTTQPETRTETVGTATYVISAGPPIITGTYTTYTYGSWVAAGPASDTNLTSTPRTAPGPIMPPCYPDRHYDIVPVAISSLLSSDPESPTSVKFSANLVGGYLSADDHLAIGLRVGLKVVGIPVNGEYYTKDINDSIVPGTTNPFTFNGSNRIDDPVAINATVRRYTAFNEPYTSDSFTVSRPPLNYGDKICFIVILPNSQGTMDRDGIVQTSTGNTESVEKCSDRVGDKPYFKAFGSDIFAGGAFTSNGICGTPADASIIGQYRMGITGGGASSELAAIALISVSYVASASLRTSPPTQENGLTFANFGTSAPINIPSFMGGQYGLGHCAPDYFNNEQFSDDNPNKGTRNGATLPLQSLQDNKQTVVTRSPRTDRLKIQSNNPLNIRHTVFIDGDAEIVDDISNDNTAWADSNALPYLTIVVRGNLYIKSTVKNITGVFIAQPDPTRLNTGRIFTCSEWKDSADPTRNTSIVDTCRNQLVINGAFIAQQVVLERTTGTLSNARNNGGIHEPASSPNIAEVFQYSPEFYISKPVFRGKPIQYDSIKGLPPIL